LANQAAGQRRLNLMWIEIDLSIQQGTRELLCISDRSLTGELVREELRMVLGGQFHPPGFQQPSLFSALRPRACGFSRQADGRQDIPAYGGTPF